MLRIPLSLRLPRALRMPRWPARPAALTGRRPPLLDPSRLSGRLRRDLGLAEDVDGWRRGVWPGDRL